jgi:hypothetical protein
MKMAHRKRVDMAIDTAAKGAAGDPVIRKPTAILPAEGGEKFHCNLAGSTRLIEVVTHIEECLRSANPAFADAWNGKTDCLTSGNPGIQELNAMIEAAQQLYEQHTQRGSPPMALFSNKTQKEMSDMDFRVTREAAQFATEAHIHHMCAVANSVQTCCLGGPVHILVTKLGPEGLIERRTALINEQRGHREGAAPVRRAGELRAACG